MKLPSTMGWAAASVRSNVFRVLAIILALAIPAANVLGQTMAPRNSPESRHRLPLTKFYDTPVPLPGASPGTLIRSERTHDYYLSPEINTYRILYHSRTAGGEDVAVSGVVLTPQAPPPPKGWPAIAWAHPLEGVARTCAPSLAQNLYEGSFLSMYVNLGYAVVATDYAGLGTNARNASIDIASNAADVIYSIPAARAAVPQLGTKWLAMGALEGAPVALGVAERQSNIRDSSFLGSIGIGAVADLPHFYEQLAQGSSQRMLVFLAYGIKTLFPQFRVEDMLNDTGMALYRRIETSCSLGAENSSPSILRPDWQRNKFVREFFRRNELGQKTASAPLLVIASEGDPLVPLPLTTSTVSQLCKRGNHVQFYRYQSPNPKAVIGDSVRDQIEWIQGRFAGRTAPSNCP